MLRGIEADAEVWKRRGAQNCVVSLREMQLGKKNRIWEQQDVRNLLPA